MPLQAYEDPQCFKVYFCDVGLLNTLANLPIKTIIHGNQLFQEFHGALTENFVAQELAPYHKHLQYWASENRAEIDFILQCEESIYPLEVKSGESNHKKSLMIYRDKYHAPLLLRASPKNLDQQPGFLNIPLYLVGHLTTML